MYWLSFSENIKLPRNSHAFGIAIMRRYGLFQFLQSATFFQFLHQTLDRLFRPFSFHRWLLVALLPCQQTLHNRRCKWQHFTNKVCVCGASKLRKYLDDLIVQYWDGLLGLPLTHRHYPHSKEIQQIQHSTHIHFRLQKSLLAQSCWYSTALFFLARWTLN